MLMFHPKNMTGIWHLMELWVGKGSGPKRCSWGMSETLSTSKNVTLVLTHICDVEVTQHNAAAAAGWLTGAATILMFLYLCGFPSC